LVKWDCTSMMKYSSLGHFSLWAAGSSVSSSSTFQKLPPYTLLLARKAVAMPIVLAMNSRRPMPSFLDFSSAMRPIKSSTACCLAFWGRGMNSSFETTWVGTGESTPFLRSRTHFGIHIERLLERDGEVGPRFKIPPGVATCHGGSSAILLRESSG